MSNTPNTGILDAIPEFPDSDDDAIIQSWLSDRIDGMFAHVRRVAEAGIPMGLIAIAALPEPQEPQSTILIPGQQAPAVVTPGRVKFRIMLESPAITVAQQVFQIIAEGKDIDDEGRNATLDALAQTKVALERAHQAVSHLIDKIKPHVQDASSTTPSEGVPEGDGSAVAATTPAP